MSSGNAALVRSGRAALLTPLLTRAFDGLSEDVSDSCRVLAENVGVDAQGYGWIGVAESCGDYVYRDTCQEQCGGVQVAQVVQPGGAGSWLTCCAG